MKLSNKDDYRRKITATGLQLLFEYGLSGLTQPQICSLIGMRQSHLTYYYPTRTTLIVAVAQAALDASKTVIDSWFTNFSTCEKQANIIAQALFDRRVTRVILALIQAADQEPEVAKLLTAFGDDMRRRFSNQYPAPTFELLRAFIIGLTVVENIADKTDKSNSINILLKTGLNLLIESQ